MRVAAGCEWVNPIYLSEASITGLRELQTTHPEVRDDRIAIATHNRQLEEFCS